MPATSIDTFFACSLLVSVALISTAFLAGTTQTQISGMQDLNKQDYLRNIAEHIVSSCGSPVDWGSSEGVPSNFGLSAAGSSGLNELDIDKVTRLNTQSKYTLSYPQVLASAHLSKIAFGVSVSQMLQIEITLSASTLSGDATTYTFQISVSQDSGPVAADLHCYVVCSNFTFDVYNSTSSMGIGYVNVEVPNSSSGPALLLVFARTAFDGRIMGYTEYPFIHLSGNLQPNLTFLSLSAFNSSLEVNPNFPNVTLTGVYAFSYTYQSFLSMAIDGTYQIPSFTDKGSIILVAQGSNDSVQFNEWIAYPDVPLDFGANFSQAETNIFVYPVTINGALYKVTLRFGDVVP
jgi:hypothetical protein